MFIGIDIGGTNIKGILLNGNKIFKKIEIPTKSRTNKKILISQVFEIINDLIKKCERVNKIGIGVPGPVDFQGQKTLNPPNVPALSNLSLAKIIKDKFSIEVIIDNDVNCLTLAETILGATKGKDLVIGLTMGTGTGGGIVLNNKIFHGAGVGAGEMGHMIIEKNGRICSCGNKGCLEAYINKTGIKKTAFEIFGKRAEGMHMREFDLLSAKGDKKALRVYEITGQYLGIGLANIVNILNPEIIVIGGGLIKAGEFILKPARREMKKNIISPLAKNTKVVKVKLGKFSGAIGAALLEK